MATGLYIMFHGFNAYNGICKKISYQIEALRHNGLRMHLCHYEIGADGCRSWLVDDRLIARLGNGIAAKLRKRIDFSPILRYADQERPDFAYIRTFHNANPFTIHLVKTLHRMGLKIYFEIPTYPYDHEYSTLSEKLQLTMDRLFRQRLCRYVDYIITFSEDKTIFGRPTLRISNGIDFSKIPLRKPAARNTDGTIHLVAVAEIHFWHGYDRLVKGLADYYAGGPSREVHFHLAGPFAGTRERNAIMDPIRQHHLQSYVHLYGPLHGTELDNLFDRCDFAIGSLGRHRSGITHIKTLKNREYAARGFAFTYAEQDPDFETMPYVWKVPADESHIDIHALLTFYDRQTLSPASIRQSIQHLSWDEQMSVISRTLTS